MPELVSGLPLDPAAASADAGHAAADCRAFTRALARGEDAAWREFFDRYHYRLRGYLAACWHGEPDAVDDLLQDTLVRAVKHVRAFDDEDVLWSWLSVLARSAVADHGRKRYRFRAFLDRFRKQADREPNNTPDERLAIALTRLAPGDRELIRMKYEHGDSVRDIAAALDTTEKAIESRLTRCRARLRKHLDRLAP
jgi:RNA polymerase sigma-70 factor (ECF subfamily)